MKEMYKLAQLPDNLTLEDCPVCGAVAELWSYSKDFQGGPIYKVVMCSHNEAIGPRDNDIYESCPLIMPPDDFCHGRIVEAVKFWNDYALALTGLRRERAVKKETPFGLYPHQQAAIDKLREGTTASIVLDPLVKDEP